MRYQATQPDGTVKEYRDINRAVYESPHGTIIVDTVTGKQLKVWK